MNTAVRDERFEDKQMLLNEFSDYVDNLNEMSKSIWCQEFYYTAYMRI